MTIAVRALSVFLTVWLTATAAFPPCCWSMASAHDHQRTPETVPSDGASAAHHHDHHHGNDDSGATGGAGPVLSSIPANDCDAEFADTATTLSGVQRAAMRPAAESAADFVVPAISAHDVPRSDTSPPGSTFTAAFLSPLRI